MKLFAINAGYSKTQHLNRNWYYVFADNTTNAKKKFKSIVGWLDIYRIVQYSEQGKAVWLKEYNGYNKTLIGGIYKC